MNYGPTMAGMDHVMFDNVFVNPEAYHSFLATGTWPEKTVMVLENRGAENKGSINKSGHYQSTDMMGVEVHIKDSAHFPNKWAFVTFDSDQGDLVPPAATCYSCHADHAAGELVRSLAARRRRIESGDEVVVGVNRFETTEPSPLQADGAGAIEVVDPATEAAAVDAICEWRAGRDATAVAAALDDLRDAAKTDANLMEASIACAKVGVTTGEWTGALREVFGEFRAPTGVAAAVSGEARGELTAVRARVRATGEELHQRLRMLVGKPGLDGHSNGAEQVAVRARDVGFEVIYQGIRLTPAQIVAAAVQESAHVVGLSILSGSHMEVVPAVVDGLRRRAWTTSRWWWATSSRRTTPRSCASGGSPRSSRRRTSG